MKNSAYFSPSAIGRFVKERPYSLFVASLAISLAWCYWTTLLQLHSTWLNDPQYSHGYLVPAFAVLLLYLRRDRMKEWQFRLCVWGLPVLILAGILKAFAGLIYFDFLDAFSLLVYITGAMILIGGKQALRWSWPAIIFLAFMIPLPFQVERILAHPLQRIATISSTYLLQTFGFPALAEGNVIVLNEVRMGVVEACSGLSMLTVFFALAFAVAYLIQRPMWEKALVFSSAIPIAIITNVVRITVTGVLHETAGSELANLVFHDLAGWLMMPFALGLLWLELKVLSRAMITPTASKPVPVPSVGLPASDKNKKNKDGEFKSGESKSHEKTKKKPSHPVAST